ncbi:DUF881 domain-containing protein [Nocardioides marmoribigeumensis]|uniref:Uncharacterized protein YlxW (UPF0749 family) n=1 Tax=Nocardioides marmoribigeumensis TaxID=433649 RepID=A0ABU2C0Y2_9ACTN|nr:DUF881 domain-containing protein [Nocardioides marmoribigeumensis]MDR7364301.1 uncharacterized protein YlxW (UPF0749 family) [Nocardioides marmoribigeumensis]
MPDPTPATTPPTVAPAGPEEPRRRALRELLHPRWSRGQAVAAILLAGLGFAAAVQVRSNDQDQNFTGARQSDLIALINSLSLAAERARDEIDQLTRTRDQLRGSTSSDSAALRLAREQERTWGILAGTLAVRGPGVRITVDPRGAGVGTDQILNGLQELRDAGAESIEINDRVRVVAQTAITDTSGGGGRVAAIRVDGVTLQPPYVIDVIGDPDTLSSGVDFQGGFVTEVEDVGGAVRVERAQRIEITSLHATQRLRYATPDPQDPEGSGE